jgi:hypothetical protein
MPLINYAADRISRVFLDRRVQYNAITFDQAQIFSEEF